EVGCRLLLLDEDTCATNLMIRDARMQALVEKAGEPITPFIDRVRQLAEWPSPQPSPTGRGSFSSTVEGIEQGQSGGVSSILVLGGSGDYFDVADTVIRMDNYRPFEVTAEARRIA